MMDFVWLGGAAFLAGLVDAVVGGGGLIQVPAIFSFLPKEAPATLLGTNKLASICGTGAAAVNYGRRVRVAWSAAAPAAIAAFALSFVGAWTVTRGTRLAIKHGSAFVRELFLVLVSTLIVKTAFDAVVRLTA